MTFPFSEMLGLVGLSEFLRRLMFGPLLTWIAAIWNLNLARSRRIWLDV